MSEETQNQSGGSSRWLLFAAGAVGAYALWRCRRYVMVREVCTGASRAYPDLVSQVFVVPLGQVRDAAAQACDSLPRWETACVEERAVHARFRALPCCMGGRVTVSLEPLMEGRLTKVGVCSALQGIGPDLGANARAIRALQARLRELLASGGPA